MHRRCVKPIERRSARASGDVPKKKIVTTRIELCHSREEVPCNCLGHPVPASLRLWPRVYYPVRSPCFTMVGQNKGQECQKDKIECGVAELQVDSAAQARQGEYECRCSVWSPQAQMCLTLRNLRH